nr:uncharacterized protein LOC133577874 [Nerophis lumbriciformis]XP_061787953.1 uncharacterized protein LOC133577874 [Nerophis lumbriciformis]
MKTGSNGGDMGCSGCTGVRVPGVSLGNYTLKDLEYADDTTLFSETADQLREALGVFDEETKQLGLKISWSKTELMHIGDGPDPPPFLFEDTPVHFVPTFRYLGSTVTNTGDLKREVDRRRALAASVMQSLWRPLWRHRHISRDTKLRVYNSSVISVLLYGSETWPLNNILAARLDGFDSRALRRIEGITWSQHVTNKTLRELTQQLPASRLAAMRRVRWYGHVIRLPGEHPTRKILDFNPQRVGWRRPRGAPSTRWLDVLAQDLKACNVTMAQAQHLAHNRPRWRDLVAMVGSTRPEVQED